MLEEGDLPPAITALWLFNRALSLDGQQWLARIEVSSVIINEMCLAA